MLKASCDEGSKKDGRFEFDNRMKRAVKFIFH